MPTQEEILRLRFGGGAMTPRPQPYMPSTGFMTPGVMAAPPPRPPVPYTPTTMFTEGGGGMQTPAMSLADALRKGLPAVPDPGAARTTRRAARSANQAAKKTVRKARRAVKQARRTKAAPLGTTKQSNVRAKRQELKAAKQTAQSTKSAARATRGTVRKALKQRKKMIGV